MLFSYNCHHFRPFHGRLCGRLCVFRICFAHLLLKNDRCVSNRDKTTILQQLCHQKADQRMPKNSTRVTGNQKKESPKGPLFEPGKWATFYVPPLHVVQFWRPDSGQESCATLVSPARRKWQAQLAKNRFAACCQSLIQLLKGCWPNTAAGKSTADQNMLLTRSTTHRPSFEHKFLEGFSRIAPQSPGLPRGLH